MVLLFVAAEGIYCTWRGGNSGFKAGAWAAGGAPPPHLTLEGSDTGWTGGKYQNEENHRLGNTRSRLV